MHRVKASSGFAAVESRRHCLCVTPRALGAVLPLDGSFRSAARSLRLELSDTRRTCCYIFLCLSLLPSTLSDLTVLRTFTSRTNAAAAFEAGTGASCLGAHLERVSLSPQRMAPERSSCTTAWLSFTATGEADDTWTCRPQPRRSRLVEGHRRAEQVPHLFACLPSPGRLSSETSRLAALRKLLACGHVLAPVSLHSQSVVPGLGTCKSKGRLLGLLRGTA